MSKKKILVVDDEVDIVKLLQTTLTDKGYEVIVAFDAVSALHSAHRDRPDLMILDIVMPAGDGYAVCETLRRSTHTLSLPIILLTGKMGEGGRKRAFEVGANFYITKPYDREELLCLVEKTLTPSDASEKDEE
jgi:DNA-binding response OmpR family regulator